MSPSELKEKFGGQQKSCLENIRQLENDLQQQKELYLKLQGAIEALDLLAEEDKKQTADDLAEALTGMPIPST
jgi:hypothetical protein